jgi:hypothetical protein
MLHIMLACVRTGQFVPTGIETDLDTFIALPEALSLTQCRACGGNHYWTKSQTWICTTGCSPPALLPADVVMGCLTERVWNPKAMPPAQAAIRATHVLWETREGCGRLSGDSRKEVTRVRLPRSERPDVRV